jgi:mono/diheme cytochrome c family protein
MRLHHRETSGSTTINHRNDTSSKTITNSDTAHELIKTGRATYEKYCSSCHGSNREGNPPAIPSLRDVTQRLPDREILRIINQGRGQMPPFEYLSQSKKDAVVAFLSHE